MVKILNRIILIIGFIVAVVMMLMYKSCNNYKAKYLSEKVDKERIIYLNDSILSLPPDTVMVIDTVIREKSIYITRNDTALKKPYLEPKMWCDSIINDSIDIRLTFTTYGITRTNYEYKPIYKYQEKIVEKKIPKYIELIKEVKVTQSGLFIDVGLGYSEQVDGKAGLMFLSKKQNTYRYDYVRHGSVNMHFVSYGIRF